LGRKGQTGNEVKKQKLESEWKELHSTAKPNTSDTYQSLPTVSVNSHTHTHMRWR